jgi:hypothetical protein
MGPAHDMHELPGVPSTRIGRAPRVRPADELTLSDPQSFPVRVKPRRPARLLLGAALAAVLLVVLGLAVGRLVTRASTATATAPPPVTTPTSARQTPATPAPGTVAPTSTQGPAVVLPSPPPATTEATTPPAPATGTFWLTDDVSVLVITTARLDQGIARISTPHGSNAVPRISMRGRTLKLGVGTEGHDGKTTVDVVLDDRVLWSLRFGGGARRMTVDMHGGLVRRIDVSHGIGTLDVRTPRLTGTLPVTMDGGIGTWRFETRGRDDVRVRARHGGGNLVLYGKGLGGLDRGVAARSDAPGRGGLDIDAQDGFGTLTVAAG